MQILWKKRSRLSGYVPSPCLPPRSIVQSTQRRSGHITQTNVSPQWLPIEYRITYKLCLIMHLVHTNRAPQYLSDSVQTVARSSSRPGLRSSDTAVYAKPRCRSKFVASLMRDLLHGTVYHTISIKSVTLVFSSAASKLNYFVEHTSLVLVSDTGRSVNSAIEMTVLLSLKPTCRLNG